MPPLEQMAETEEQKARRLTAWYRETFKSDEDLAVLTDILSHCGWWVNDADAITRDPTWTPEFYMARHTLGQYILTKMGTLTSLNGVGILRALKKLPFDKE